MNESFWQRLVWGVRRLRQQPRWPTFAGADWPDHIMTLRVTDDFHAKQGRSTGRWVVTTEGKSLAVYLKRHYRLPWWRGVFAALWPDAGWTPALEEWRHLEWARAQDIPVPTAVAACEYIGPWTRLRSFLAIEELAGMLPLHRAIPAAAALQPPDRFARWKRGLVAEMARLVRLLHDQRRFHKDLYLCHFFVAEADLTRQADFRGRVHVIDLHRLGHHRWNWRRWQGKDLGQLLYSSEIEGVAARDRLRFWRLYLGADRGKWQTNLLRRYITIKWRTYRRHNLRKRQRSLAA